MRGVRLAIEEGGDQGGILAPRPDPAQPAPAAHLGLGVPHLMEAGPERDDQQLTGEKVVRVGVPALQGLDHRGHHGVGRKHAAIHQRRAAQATGGEVGRRRRGRHSDVDHRGVAVGRLAGAPPLEEVGARLGHVVGGDDQLPQRIPQPGLTEPPLERLLEALRRVLGCDPAAERAQLMEGVAENPRALAEVEVHQVRPAQPRPLRPLGMRGGQPDADQASGGGPGDHVEAVGEPPLLPRLRADQLLEPRDHPCRDQTADPAPVDGEHAEAVGWLPGHAASARRGSARGRRGLSGATAG